MKKLITTILFISMAVTLSFAAPKKTKIDLSKKVDSIVLDYNEWGTINYSRWQSGEIDITDLFNGNLPQKGDVINFVWKGKCNKNINKLHILMADVDKNFHWLHLRSEENNNIPVAKNIKANTDFEFSVDVTLDFSPKTNVKLYFSCGEKDAIDAEISQNPYDIYGVKLGTHTWQSKVSGNVITWEKGYDNADAGWDFSHMDLSTYDRVRVEIESTNAPVSLRLADKDWKSNFGFGATAKNVFEAKLTGEGSWDKDPAPIDPSKGIRVYLNQWNDGVARTEDKTTVVKSIQFLYPGEYADAGALGLFGRAFGGVEENSEVRDSTVIWKKGSTDAKAGWNLGGIDLSEYDSVRITLEKTDTEINVYVTDKNGGNWKRAKKVAPNTYEVKLTGEGSDSKEPLLNPSEGVRFVLQSWKDKPLKKDMKTVVKSIELINEKKSINENLKLAGSEFGSSSWRAIISDNGVIEWEWDKKEKYPSAGWKVEDIDLSAYKGIRVELESTTIPLDMRLIQRKGGECHIGFNAVSPTVLEAYFDGNNCNWSWPQGAKWNPENCVAEIHVRALNLSKAGLKSVIKSIQLLSKDDIVAQPENLMLNGAKFGSYRNNAWIDEDFAINWQKGRYAECGWKLEKLENDIVEIKVSSTDVPLRLRIRENDYKNGASYLDDGSHIFRVNLKTKKMINTKGNLKEPEWTEKTAAWDFSNGAIIDIEPVNGVPKDGKKTVVEYIKVE